MSDFAFEHGFVKRGKAGAMEDALEDEIYGGEVPTEDDVEGEGEGEADHEGGGGEEVESGPGVTEAVDQSTKPSGSGAGQSAKDADDETDIETMKQRLKEMEEEAAKLKAMQATVQKDMQGGSGSDGGGGNREEADARSIYVGNVDYGTTPEELQEIFSSCGTVNRVTILTDKFGSPKGFAYVEFLEVDAVSNALLLANTEIRGRQIKVSAKRTNVPGLKIRGRGGHPAARGAYNPYFRPPRRPFYAAPYGAPGYSPRGRGMRGAYRGAGRGAPYY